MSIFSQDSLLSRVLNRIGDLMVLNIITLICCIPVVTIGAALTSMYQLTLKMVRNEEGPIISSYFKALKENWKQASILWAIGGGVSLFLLFDIYILGKLSGTFIFGYRVALFVLLLFVIMFTVFTFVTLARFENTTKNTLKNGILFCLIHIFKSILMFIVMLLPIVLVALSNRFLIGIVLAGLSLPAYVTSFYFRSLFEDF